MGAYAGAFAGTRQNREANNAEYGVNRAPDTERAASVAENALQEGLMLLTAVGSTGT